MITQKDIKYVATSSYSQGEEVIALELLVCLREQLKKKLRSEMGESRGWKAEEIVDSVFGVEAKK